MVAELQPKAVIFSDEGPGCRWVGNEKGFAFATNWAFLRSKDVHPGYERYWELQQGHADGDAWVPAECDVSIRPGWFYHEKEDGKVKTVDQLVDLYYRSVGHNGSQLINFPVTPEGLIHPTDSARAVEAYQVISKELATNLLKGAKVKATATRGDAFSTRMLTDGDFHTYWATPDGVTTATLSFTFRKPTQVNRLKLQEYIPLGQRVERFVVEYLDHGVWTPINAGEETTTIGYQRLLRFKTITTRQLRIRFLQSRGPLCINEVGAYYAPNAKESYTERMEEVATLPFSVADTTPKAITFDLGESKTIRAFFYLPTQSVGNEGTAANYELWAGETPEAMQKVAEGEFSNIRNHPVLQEIYFTPVSARYIQLRATRMVRPGEALKYERIAIQ